MAAKLLIQQGGVTRELTAQDFNSVQYDTQAGTRYELLDDNGNVIHDYTTRVENGKLLIDVAGTSASPDFILNNYTSYFPAPASGGMGSGYFGTAAAESTVNSAVKASTVGSSSTNDKVVIGGLLGGATTIGIAAWLLNNDEEETPINSGNQNNTTSNNNSASQNNAGDKTNNSANQNNAGDNTNNSASQNNTGDNTNSSANQNNTGNNTNNSTSQNNAGDNTNSSASQNNTDNNTNNSTSQNNAGDNTNSSASQNNTGDNTNNSTSQNNTGDNQSDTTNDTSDTTSNTSGNQIKDVLHGNSIKLPTAYTHEVLRGEDLNAITQAAKGGVEMNQYKSSEADKKIIINDLNNLSREVQTELSLFVAGLLNPIREDWRVGIFKVNDGIMNFAQDVANEYTANDKSIFTLNGHYVEGITRAAAKYGLNTGNNYYENAGAYGGSRDSFKSITLDALKAYVYNTVVGMLFEDAASQHGHAKSMLNAGSNFADNTNLLGIDTSSINTSEFNMHFISVPENSIAYVSDQAQFAATLKTPEIINMTNLGESVYSNLDSPVNTNNTDNNSDNQENANGNTDNNSGSQEDVNGNTDNNSGSQEDVNGSTDNNSDNQTKDVLHGNSIKLPTAYTHQLLSGSDLDAITQAAKGGEEMNQYQSNAENKKIIISDLNNLSREVQTELSLFMAQLLNPIRQQWGVATYKVTEGAMNFAQDVANEYTDNKQSLFALDGHYVSGIQRAAAKYGLNASGQYYENAGAHGSSDKNAFKNITLDDLKSYMYSSIVGMLFDDAHSKHGHAKALLNAKNIQDQDLDTDYLGVDTSSIDGGEINIHFIASTDNDAYVKDRATFAAKIQTPEITSMPATQTATRIAYVDDDNSHLSTTQFADSDDNAPQITQKFTFSQLLEGNVRQLADEYDENDVLALSQNAFSALNKDQSNLHEHISYDSTTGLLSYDADGVSGSIAPVAFAQLAQGLQQEQIQFEIL